MHSRRRRQRLISLPPTAPTLAVAGPSSSPPLSSTIMSSSSQPSSSTMKEAAPVIVESKTNNNVIGVRITVLCTSRDLEYDEQLNKKANNKSRQSQQRQQQQVVVEDDNNQWSEQNMKAVKDLWNLSPDEESKLRDLQQKLQDVDHFKNDPNIILRYMTGPSGYKAAEGLFRKMVQWRIENGIDDLLTEYKPPPLLLHYNPAVILKGLDREKDPIYVERAGATDAHGMLKHFTKDELLTHAIWMRELNTQGTWLDEYEKNQGHKVKDVTVVYDLEGLNSRHLHPHVIDIFKEIMLMTQEKYPGPIKRIIIIRCPAIVRAGWCLVRHIFSKHAQDKMIFAGKTNYLKILDKYMDLHVLPPCIYENGQGESAIGLPERLDGGTIPDDYLEIDNNFVEPLLTTSFKSNNAYSSRRTTTYRMFDSF